MEGMRTPFLQSEVKTIMLQLLSAVALLHDNWMIHRDLKTSNLLLNNRGEIKVADFGLARKYGSPLGSMTQLVVTLWYRSVQLYIYILQKRGGESLFLIFYFILNDNWIYVKILAFKLIQPISNRLRFTGLLNSY